MREPLDSFRPGALRLCRSCGRAFKPAGHAPEIACDLSACQLWAESYREALRFGAELPPEYGMQAPPAPVAAPARTHAQRSHRTKMRRLLNTAVSNELNQERREQAAVEHGIETVSL